MSFYDVMIICSIILAGKPLHMCGPTAMVHLHTCWHPCQITIYTESLESHHLFSKPIFMPVTYIYVYIYIYIYTYIYIYMGKIFVPYGKEYLEMLRLIQSLVFSLEFQMNVDILQSLEKVHSF